MLGLLSLGSAQYHVNADIAYSAWKYYEATGDIGFMRDFGAEILFETARAWVELGHFADGQFRIDAVTGPDEYACIVDNNYYTNVMARFNLARASELRATLAAHFPDALAGLERRIGLEAAERRAWEEAAERMYIPYDAARDITPQDDGFLRRGEWDFAGTPALALPPPPQPPPPQPTQEAGLQTGRRRARLLPPPRRCGGKHGPQQLRLLREDNDP